jgi:hypothetical protein
MSKVRIIHYGFFIPENRCVKKSRSTPATHVLSGYSRPCCVLFKNVTLLFTSALDRKEREREREREREKEKERCRRHVFGAKSALAM